MSITVNIPKTVEERWEKSLSLVTGAGSSDPATITAIFNEVKQKAAVGGELTYRKAYAILSDKSVEAHKKHDSKTADALRDVMAVFYIDQQLETHKAKGTYELPDLNYNGSTNTTFRAVISAAAQKATAEQKEIDRKQQEVENANAKTVADSKLSPLSLAIQQVTKSEMNTFASRWSLHPPVLTEAAKVEQRIAGFLSESNRLNKPFDEQLYDIKNSPNSTWKDIWVDQDAVINILKRSAEITKQREQLAAQHQQPAQPVVTKSEAVVQPEVSSAAPQKQAPAVKTEQPAPAKTEQPASKTESAAAPEEKPVATKQTQKVGRSVTHFDAATEAVGDGELAKAAINDAFKLEAKKSFKNDPDKDNTIALQRGLERVGLRLEQWGIDGKYGNETKGQVAAFQKSVGLPETGIADPDTIRRLQVEEVKVLAAQYKSGTLTPEQKTALVTEYNDVSAIEGKLSDAVKADLKTALAGLQGQFTQADGAIFVAVGTAPGKGGVASR